MTDNAKNLGWTEEQQRTLEGIIDTFLRERDPLIAMLQEVQSTLGYLPKQAVEQISRALRISQAQIFGVATFYTQFSFVPKGRHTILCCQGTACHVRGGTTIFEEMKRNLEVEEGGTTEDGRFTLEKVYCVGCCSLAPAIIVDKTAHGKLSPGKTKNILEKYT